MTTQLAADEKVMLGRKYPNLVMLYDSEKGYEFRVQCEVVFEKEEDKEKATRVKDLMVGKKPSKKELEEIRDIVKEVAKKNANSSELFLQILDLAIADQEPFRQDG